MCLHWIWIVCVKSNEISHTIIQRIHTNTVPWRRGKKDVDYLLGSCYFFCKKSRPVHTFKIVLEISKFYFPIIMFLHVISWFNTYAEVSTLIIEYKIVCICFDSSAVFLNCSKLRKIFFWLIRNLSYQKRQKKMETNIR